MYYSITFTNRLKEKRNTYDNWCLIPTSRPTIALPGINTKFVTVPGRSDPIDLSTYLTGQVVKTARSGNFEFLVDNRLPGLMLHGKRTTNTSGVVVQEGSVEDYGYGLQPGGSGLKPGSGGTSSGSGGSKVNRPYVTRYSSQDWISIYEDMCSFLHGQRLTMVLEEDPDFYYEGRFNLDSWQPGESFSTVTISYQLDADKKHI